MTSQSSTDENARSNRERQLQELHKEHEDCLVFADQIARIAQQDDDQIIIRGMQLVRDYNDREMEAHLQHEEQTIFAPLIQQYRSHIGLCIELGKEHGLLRTLAESIEPGTAREDLAEFAAVLRSHTLKEEQQLFPALDALFSHDQLEAVLNFAPFQRAEMSTPQSTGSNEGKAENDGDWMRVLVRHFTQAGQTGGSIVLLPLYQPGLVRRMADYLGLAVYDFRREEMKKRGAGAASISLEHLHDCLLARSDQGGIAAHNAESLLSVKTVVERKAWLKSFLETEWPNPVLLPITVFHEDVEPHHGRVCDLRPYQMPASDPGEEPYPPERIKYDVTT